MRQFIWMIAVLLMGILPAQGQQSREILYVNGRIETATGKVIEKGQVLVKNGKIAAVGTKLAYSGSVRIDLKGRTLTPGLVTMIPDWDHPNPSSNSPETAIVRGLNPFDPVYNQLIQQGFTTVNVFPRGRGIAGQSMTVLPGIPSFRRSLVQVQGPLVVYFSAQVSMRSRGRRGRTKSSTAYVPSTVTRILAQYLALAKRMIDRRKGVKKPVSKTKKPAVRRPVATSRRPSTRPKRPMSPKAAALMRLKIVPFVKFLMGRQRMIVVCANAAEVLYLKLLFKPYEKYNYKVLLIPRMPTHNLHEAVEKLDKKKFILVDYLNLNPYNYYQPNYRKNIAGMYAKKGIPLVFRPSKFEGGAALSFKLAFLHKLGLPRLALIQSLTLQPAKALGIDRVCGSIEKGKLANFVVWSGDPLDPPSEIDMVIQGGRVVYRRENK